MKRLIYTPNFLADLRSIRDYIAQDNLEAAITMGEGFIKTCELIAQHPEIGVRKGGADSTQRMFTHRGYPNRTTVYIRKNRQGPIGAPELIFNKEKMTFTVLDRTRSAEN